MYFIQHLVFQMNDIMQKILQAQTALQASIKNVTVHQQSGCWLWSWLFSDDKVDGVDTKRVALYLEHAVGNICNIFKVSYLSLLFVTSVNNIMYPETNIVHHAIGSLTQK